jgi:hypothetical protein
VQNGARAPAADKLKPDTKPRQVEWTANRPEVVAPVAACDIAERILSLVSELHYRAFHTRDELARTGEIECHALVAADSVAELKVERRRLDDLLALPGVTEAFQAANDHRPVTVEGRCYLSYSEAVASIAQQFHGRIIDAVGSDWVKSLGNGRKERSLERLVQSAIAKHWDKASTAIAYSGQSEHYIENLEAQIKSEQGRLQRQTIAAATIADGGQQPASKPRGNDAAAERTEVTRAATQAAKRTEWLARALLLVRDHPDWPDAEIARKVGRDKSVLSRDETYQTAAQMARARTTDLPKGHIKLDPDTGQHDVEGIAPTAGSLNDKADRGQRIPNSSYVREYCAKCDEAMKVTPDKVGTNPICERCKR